MKTLSVVGWVLVCMVGSVKGHAAGLSVPTTYRGMCDASAAVSLNADLFAVANDEDNVIRVYLRQPDSMPAFTFDMTSFLQIGKKSPEADLEGCATIGDLVYWITSHGRNAKGKDAPNRERFFATSFSITNGLVRMKPFGRPYALLLDDLVREPKLSRFNLGAAAQRAPKEKDALNIEGLTSTPEGHLLIGFRNPIPGGKALLVPLLNPQEIVSGRLARFGEPVLLDLGGFGIRSIGHHGGRYLIIAGSFDSDGESRAYEWKGGASAPTAIEGVRFPGLNPEGLTFESQDGQTEYYVLSDDGTLKIGGVDCKKLKDPRQRQFRGYTLDLGKPSAK